MFEKKLKAGIYGIFNKAEDSWSPLDIATNDTIAKRRFYNAIKNSEKIIYKNDYELYKLGEIDIYNYEIVSTKKEKVTTWEKIQEDEEVVVEQFKVPEKK